MIFGLFGKKRYPLMRPEMIQPADLLINVTEAKRIYRTYMKETGFLKDREDIAEGARMLGDEIRDHLNALKEDRAQCLADLKEAKHQLAAFTTKLASCAESEREELGYEINDCESEVRSQTEEIEKLDAEIAAFKQDKREFVIDYINCEVHGPEWRDQSGR